MRHLTCILLIAALSACSDDASPPADVGADGAADSLVFNDGVGGDSKTVDGAQGDGAGDTSTKDGATSDSTPDAPPSSSWAIAGGAGTNGRGEGIAIDGAGNLYVTGRMPQTSTFGSHTVKSKGGYDIVVVKATPGGTWAWAKGAGSSGDDEGRAIAADAAGNTYVTGRFEGSATFGSKTVVSNGKELFVAKLDPSGDFLWAVPSDGDAVNAARGIAIDGQGNSYITGYLSGDTDFGNTSLTASLYQQELFVAKLDPSGAYLWAVQTHGDAVAGNFAISGNAIARDSTGNLYVGGYLEGKADFGATTLASPKSGSFFAQGGFVAKLDAGGAFKWAKLVGGSSSYIYHVAVDAQGDVYATGAFRGTATIGGKTLSAVQDDLVLVKLASSDGAVVWAASAGGDGRDFGTSVFVDAQGSCHLTGRYNGQATFGGTTLDAGSTAYSAFVMKADPSGSIVWATSASGGERSEGEGIVVDAFGNRFTTGLFRNTVQFGSTPLTASARQIYVWKLGYGAP